VCPDEPDIHLLRSEDHNGNEPKVVALNVENKSVVSDIVHAIEGLLHVPEIRPFGFSGLVVPILKGGFRFGDFL